VPKLSELVMIFFCEKIDEFLLYVQKKTTTTTTTTTTK